MGVPAVPPKDARHPGADTVDSSAVWTKPDKAPDKRMLDRRALDKVDARILAELQSDGRVTISELGRRVNLSAAAVSERVRRLEEGGVVTGYAARVDPAQLGYGIVAYVRLDTDRGVGFRDPRMERVMARPEVLEAHHLVGVDGWILKIAARDVGHLEEFLEEASVVGRTATSIVMSSPVVGRGLLPADAEAPGLSEGETPGAS